MHSRGPLCARIAALSMGMGLHTRPFQGKRRIPILLGRVLEWLVAPRICGSLVV